MIDLAGDWSLADAEGGHPCTIRLPGEDGVTALHRAGLIPDPYFGRNEYSSRWIAERDWVARRSFDHDGGDADLVIDGLDCVAEILLNGKHLALKANAFRRWRIPTWGRLLAGRNTIEIRFRSAVQEAAARQEAQPFFVPYIAQNNPIPHGNMLRKPGCDWGWDWNIALVPFGVLGGIALEPVGPRIDAIIVSQTHLADRIDVALKVQTHGLPDGAMVTATLCGVTATAPVYRDHAHPTLSVRGAALWWPAGQGAQVLHDLTVTGDGVSATRKIGLRDLSLISEVDEAGRSFGFRVNGRDVFAKGANWVPADALHGRITRDGVRDLLQSAVDAHMNMIRVWGGGRYEADWFYDICDELGLMVWQDFMFACNLYPSTPDFLSEVGAEVRDNVARLQHHACLALWCGDNELIGALTWFPESRADRDRYLVNYDRLNRTIETALKETDPEANWWPSSPSPGPMDFGDAWHQDGSGDMHFWSVWHEGRDFDHYRDVAPRFCSEFGFQSYPSLHVIDRFTDPADRNIASPVLESHQKNAGGNARIAETMFRYFRWPERFADFVWLSQLQQGLAIRTAVTQWRSLKPHCMGALYWQLNDTWPVCSWSSLDHGGGWKLLHAMARDFYAPVIVAARPADDRIEFVGINDHPEEVTIDLRVGAITPDGRERELGAATDTIGSEARVLSSLSLKELEEDELLVWTMSYSGATTAGSSGPEIHAPRPWKAFDLLPPDVSVQAHRRAAGGPWTVSLSGATHPAFFAMPVADVPGHFRRAPVHLFPGATADFEFFPDDPGAEATFTCRDLGSATMTHP